MTEPYLPYQPHALDNLNTTLEAGNQTVLRQAPITTNEYLMSAIDHIDQAHPELTDATASPIAASIPSLGLPWEILWTKTQDEDLARKMMGLMAMHTFIVHPDNWATSTTHYAGHEYSNRYYTKFFFLPNGERRYFDEPEEQIA